MLGFRVCRCSGGPKYTIVMPPHPSPLPIRWGEGKEAEHPVAIIKAIRAVVHDKRTPREAFDLYQTLKNAGRGISRREDIIRRLRRKTQILKSPAEAQSPQRNGADEVLACVWAGPNTQ